MAQRQRIAIGTENYKEMVDKDYYYVDKTLLIKELLDSGGKVTLLTRPRRFGKTLALSMLRTFFEEEISPDGTRIDNSYYFSGCKILQAGEAYLCHMGRHPVISLTLKSAKQADFETAYDNILDAISREYIRHRYVLLGDSLTEMQRQQYDDIMNRRVESSVWTRALAFLSQCLEQYHNRRVMILLDEYDVPLESAYFRGFYGKMILFIRALFESALKTNDSLELAVITGCLRISGESVFTGLNHMKIASVLSREFASCFGFTEAEVRAMLHAYELDEKAEEVCRWYDGYLFGGIGVYNPWSVINYIKELTLDFQAFPRPYWSNTSSNDIVRNLVESADNQAKSELEELIAGRTIEKSIYEDVTYEDMRRSRDSLWSFLLFTGYLKVVSQRMEADVIYARLKIPNEEIRYLYKTHIREWFDRKIRQADLRPFYENLLEGNSEEMALFITGQLSSSISYYDNAENFYHGYLIGLLSGLEGYRVDSNKEHGYGRPDILLTPFDYKRPVIILELKCAQKFSQMEELCANALAQIESRDYASGLLDEGYLQIIKYGVCFCRKSCLVKTWEK